MIWAVVFTGCFVFQGRSETSQKIFGPSTEPLQGIAWPLPPLSYFVERLPEPPKPGSFRDRMDLEDVLMRQKGTTPEDLESIQATYLYDVFYFSKVLGSDFNPKKYPKTEEFFSKLTQTATVVVSGLKKHYKRPRPFEGHPDLVSLKVKNEPGYGYPSGHTARSRLGALVMAELAPEYKKQLTRASERVATDRILAGEHYMTDLEAGRSLGKMIFLLLREDPGFQAELASVKAAEWSHPPKILAAPKR